MLPRCSLGPLGPILLVVSLLTSGGALSGSVEHRSCAAKQHACATITMAARCCCGPHSGVVKDVSVPASQRDDGEDLTLTASIALLTVARPVRGRRTAPRPWSGPPTRGSDRPILFGDLRL